MQTSTRYHCPITRCGWTFDATTDLGATDLSADPWKDVQRVAFEQALRRAGAEYRMEGHLAEHGIYLSEPLDVEALRAQIDRINQ